MFLLAQILLSRSRSWETFITVMNALQHNDLAKDVFLANDRLRSADLAVHHASGAHIQVLLSWLDRLAVCGKSKFRYWRINQVRIELFYAW
jgi:hypothetical protein